MYEIEVCPVKKLYDIAYDGDMSQVSAIVISSYEVKKDLLCGFQSLLVLHFADTEDGTRQDCFDEKRADEIADFVNSLPEDTDTLFVCCDRGESRSAAVAAAILRYNDENEYALWDNPAYHPNPLVYRLTRLAFLSYEVEKRVERSKTALSRLINSKRNN